jgi:hypothetical protein
MFTFDPDAEIQTGDIINGRLVEFVPISTFGQFLGAIWALLFVLTLQYTANIVCWFTDFSIYESSLNLSLAVWQQQSPLSTWAVAFLVPFGHASRFHFIIEMILLVFLIVHTSNVLGQFTTLLVTIVTPYFALILLLVLGEPSVAVGTISASAALLAVAMIANRQYVFRLGWAQQAISLSLGVAYLAIAPLGAILTAMSGIAIGVLVSYLSNINLSGSERPLSRPLLSITYYYVPLRFALLAVPVALVMLVGAVVFGRN